MLTVASYGAKTAKLLALKSKSFNCYGNVLIVIPVERPSVAKSSPFMLSKT